MTKGREIIRVAEAEEGEDGGPARGPGAAGGGGGKLGGHIGLCCRM